MGHRLIASQGDIQMEMTVGGAEALDWLMLPAQFGGSESEINEQSAEINKDSRKAFAGVFQLFLQGQVGGEQRKGVLAMTGGLSDIHRSALRGPGDIFLVMAGLTYAQAAVAKFGNPEFTGGNDPALRDYIIKCNAADAELTAIPLDGNYMALANWCGGNGGLVKEDYHSVLGFIDYVSTDVAKIIGWNNNQYLNPEDINDNSTGQVANTKVAMVKLKKQSPWCAYWIQERVFGKALNKQASQQKATEKAQMAIMNKVAETTDQAGRSLSDTVDALNKAQKNISDFFGVLGDWIVPVLLGAGALYLLFTFAPAIVEKGSETAEAFARSRRKRLSR